MKSRWQRARETKRKRLNDQLCENTGTHFLDSGGAGGRMWQQNARRPPKDRPAEWCVWEVYGGRLSCDYVKNTLDVLCDWLTDGPAATRARRSWGQFMRQESIREDDKDYSTRSWEELLEAWCKLTDVVPGNQAYTYNEDNCLSQDFVYVTATDKFGDDIVILRTHNGADARGGFSAPTFWEQQEEWPDTYWSGECYIDGSELDPDCPAVEWDSLWDECDQPEDLTPEQVARDVSTCIVKRGILYNGDGLATPLDVLAYIWDECNLAEYAALPAHGVGLGFVVVVDKTRAVGAVKTYDGSWEIGEVYPS